MSVVALIPARGGSKGIPRKNIRLIAGKPLIAWTIEAALAARGIDQVVVSTEDVEIAEVARSAGAAVPFMRPIALAADDSSGMEPVFHALTMLPDHDALVLLQPTSPLRGARAIEGVLEMAARLRAPAVVSVCAVAKHPVWMYRVGEDARLAPLAEMSEGTRRQDLTPIYALNGAIYYARADWLIVQRSFVAPDTVGYVMEAEDSVDIDVPLDWRLAELLLMDRM